MNQSKKIGSWLTDYFYMFRGTAQTLFHHTPPAHYLKFTKEGKVPVILIPGILGKWSFLKKLGDKISLHGHPVYVVPALGYNIYSIPDSAKTLRTLVTHIFPKRGHTAPRVSRGASVVQTLIEQENLRGVVLVAHSKGGLIGKYLLAHHNKDGRVLGLVAIATPFSGSAMAKLVPLEPFKELDTDSKIIHDLESHREVNNYIVSISPEYDNHVWAEQGSHLEGAENIVVPVYGHHKVIFDETLQSAVLEAVERISKR